MLWGRGILLVVAMAVILAGCGAAPATLPASSPTPSASTSLPPSLPSASTSALPDVARLTCDGSTYALQDPVVRAQADGFHVTVANTSDVALSIEIDEVGGDNAPVGESTTVWNVEPGVYAIRCRDTDRDAGLDIGWVALTVAPPEGGIVPTTLACTARYTQVIDYAAGARGEIGEPVDIAERAHTPGPTDVAETAGYAGSGTVRILRNGVPIAILTYVPDGAGGWLLSQVTGCEGQSVQ